MKELRPTWRQGKGGMPQARNGRATAKGSFLAAGHGGGSSPHSGPVFSLVFAILVFAVIWWVGLVHHPTTGDPGVGLRRRAAGGRGSEPGVDLAIGSVPWRSSRTS
jgi:hypothetical protein